MFAPLIPFRSIPGAQLRVWCYTRAFQTDFEPEETQTSLFLHRWEWKCRSVRMKIWNGWIRRFSDKSVHQSQQSLILDYILFWNSEDNFLSMLPQWSNQIRPERTTVHSFVIIIEIRHNRLICYSVIRPPVFHIWKARMHWLCVCVYFLIFCFISCCILQDLPSTQLTTERKRTCTMRSFVSRRSELHINKIKEDFWQF